jgi:hypothetical protein
MPPAGNPGQSTRSSGKSGLAKDVRIELERFPNLRRPIALWLERYPEVSDSPIFAPLEEGT